MFETTIQAPALRPPLHGLIQSAVENAGPLGIEGLAFEPEGCGAVTAINPNSGAPKVVSQNREPVLLKPVGLWAGDACTLIEGEGRDWERRAQDELAAGESYALAREFWRGDVARAATTCRDEDWANQYLTDAAADGLDVLGDGLDPVDALGCLEKALGTHLHGGRGMIHATPDALTHWHDHGLVARDPGGLVLTIRGTIVVADAGYDGSGPGEAVPDEPTSGSVWAYGTSVVYYRLGAPFLLPAGGDLAAAADRTTNDVEYRAERLGVAWHSGCAIVAVNMDLPACNVGGAS